MNHWRKTFEFDPISCCTSIKASAKLPICFLFCYFYEAAEFKPKTRFSRRSLNDKINILRAPNQTSPLVFEVLFPYFLSEYRFILFCQNQEREGEKKAENYSLLIKTF